MLISACFIQARPDPKLEIQTVPTLVRTCPTITSVPLGIEIMHQELPRCTIIRRMLIIAMHFITHHKYIMHIQNTSCSLMMQHENSMHHECSWQEQSYENLSPVLFALYLNWFDVVRGFQVSGTCCRNRVRHASQMRTLTNGGEMERS